MDDGSQEDLRNRLYGELAEAYDGFFTELVQATRIWGFWVGRRRIAGPYSAWGLARIYQSAKCQLLCGPGQGYS